LKNRETLGTGGVPGCIFLLWEVWMTDRMFRCRCWRWLWGRFFWVGWSCIATRPADPEETPSEPILKAMPAQSR